MADASRELSEELLRLCKEIVNKRDWNYLLTPVWQPLRPQPPSTDTQKPMPLSQLSCHHTTPLLLTSLSVTILMKPKVWKPKSLPCSLDCTAFPTLTCSPTTTANLSLPFHTLLEQWVHSICPRFWGNIFWYQEEDKGQVCHPSTEKDKIDNNIQTTIQPSLPFHQVGDPNIVQAVYPRVEEECLSCLPNFTSRV